MKQRAPIKRSPLRRPTYEEAIAWERKQREKARKRGIAKVGRRAKREQQTLDFSRAFVLRRSGGMCEGPSLPGVHPSWQHPANHVHHVLSRARGGGHDPSNLLHLCHSVHLYLHEHPAEATKLGLLKSARDVAPSPTQDAK